jgi:hypothetical protein
MSIHKRLSCCTYLCTWPRGIVLFAIVREKHAKICAHEDMRINVEAEGQCG